MPTQVATATMGAAALQQAYDQQKRKNVMIASVVGGIALLAVLLMGLRAAGLLGASGANPKEKLLTAKGTIPGASLLAPGRTGNASLERGAEKPPELKMPDDVYAWLKHLEKCEAQKIELTGQQIAELNTMKDKMSILGPAMGLMDPYDQSKDNAGDQDPGSFAQGKIKDLRPDWEKLVAFFRSVPPPEECRPLANDFDRALGEIPGQASDIADLMNLVSSDPQAALAKAEKMKGASFDIDRSFNLADEKLTRICEKYKVNKWFNIKADVSTGALGKTATMGGM